MLSSFVGVRLSCVLTNSPIQRKRLYEQPGSIGIQLEQLVTILRSSQVEPADYHVRYPRYAGSSGSQRLWREPDAEQCLVGQGSQKRRGASVDCRETRCGSRQREDLRWRQRIRRENIERVG